MLATTQKNVFQDFKPSIWQEIIMKLEAEGWMKKARVVGGCEGTGKADTRAWPGGPL